MSNGIYMGGAALKGKASKEIRDLVAEIKTQQDKFAKQAGKFNIWDKGGDALKSLAWWTKNPALIAASYAADFGVDYFMPSTAGDPEAIKELETAYTGGGYGEEFGEMIEEGEPSLLSSLADQGLDFAKSYAFSKAGDWLKGGKGAEKAVDPATIDLEESLEGWINPSTGKQGTLDEYRALVETRQGWTETIAEEEMSSMFSMQGLKTKIQDYFSPAKTYNANTGLFEYQQGGQVPKYYGGGSVQGGTPTIAGYFGEQGKTLGGSNKQSLAEMLGRR